MQEIEFECPVCGCQNLVEVSKNVTTSLWVCRIEEEGPVIDSEIDPDFDLDFDNAVVDHYKCAHCGFKLPCVEWPDVLKWIQDNTQQTKR
jgi:predicted RNA-binding Zn-ribbon protein involved in translation (DUF1610 family)